MLQEEKIFKLNSFLLINAEVLEVRQAVNGQMCLHIIWEINDLSNHSKHVPKRKNTIRNAKYSNYLLLCLCLLYNWRRCFYRLTIAPVSLTPDLLFTQSCNEFALFSSSISDTRSDMHLFNTSLKHFEPIAYKISEVIVQHLKSFFFCLEIPPTDFLKDVFYCTASDLLQGNTYLLSCYFP